MKIEDVKSHSGKYITDLKLITPNVFGDDRGYFFESFGKQIDENLKPFMKGNWCQDNESLSHSNVVRGLHYQSGVNAQSKLVRVVVGGVIDVVIDMRKNSLTFGEVASVFLSSENKKEFFVPRGFAHGFIALPNYDTTIFSYKCDNYYNKTSERGVFFSENLIKDTLKIHNVEMDISKIIRSEKDKYFPNFEDAEYFN